MSTFIRESKDKNIDLFVIQNGLITLKDSYDVFFLAFQKSEFKNTVCKNYADTVGNMFKQINKTK